ncbi:MAG TPA: hypothetical protein VE338_06365 [Ktedonobacterales bacterium]|nr:hypothetical protein [Ktedonobacterales bacterium]
MKSAWLVGGVLAVICVALAVYYALSGIYHPLTFSGDPYASHYKHAIVFLGLAVVALIGARFAANSGRTAR